MMPFESLRVIEACSNLSGPTTGTIFGDLGADVIKVEKAAGGDDARRFAPPYLDGMSASFRAINRNKRSVCLDFKTPGDVAKLHELVKRADVFIHNMRPGVADNLGLSGPQAMELNPRLVYGAISAYGDEGPWKSRSGYDGLAQALSGQMAANGDPGGPPVMASGGVVDKSSGLWLAIIVSAALFRREKTGKGGIVETSLLEASLFYRDLSVAQYQATGRLPSRTGNRALTFVPSDVYQAADGPMFITCAGDGLFIRLAKAIGCSQWLEDERFATNVQRVVNRNIFEPLLADVLRTRPRGEWVEIMGTAGVPCSPILDVDEALVHPQMNALGVFQQMIGGEARLLGPPWRLDGLRPPMRRGAPELGEHNDEIWGTTGG